MRGRFDKLFERCRIASRDPSVLQETVMRRKTRREDWHPRPRPLVQVFR